MTKGRENMKHFKIKVIIIALSFFTGCATRAPVVKWSDAQPEGAFEVVSDRNEQLALSWLAKAVIDKDARKNLSESITGQQEQLFGSKSASAATTSNAITDAVVGQAGSTAGGAVGSAFYLAGLLAEAVSGRALSRASQFYMQREFDGKIIETEEQADEALYEWLNKRVNAIALQNNWIASCIRDCNKTGATIKLEMKNNVAPYSNENPLMALVIFRSEEMQEMTSNSYLNRALGFEPKFTTGLGHTFQVTVALAWKNGSSVELGDDGEVWVAGFEFAGDNTLGQSIYRSIHNSMNSFSAFNDKELNYLVINGEIYSITDDESGIIIKERLVHEARL